MRKAVRMKYLRRARATGRGLLNRGFAFRKTGRNNPTKNRATRGPCIVFGLLFLRF